MNRCLQRFDIVTHFVLSIMMSLCGDRTWQIKCTDKILKFIFATYWLCKFSSPFLQASSWNGTINFLLIATTKHNSAYFFLYTLLSIIFLWTAVNLLSTQNINIVIQFIFCLKFIFASLFLIIAIKHKNNIFCN